MSSISRNTLKKDVITHDLSLIIVNWNTRDFLDKSLESIFRTTKDISFEIIVVDNNSKDDSVNMIKEKYPDVKIIANKKNEGFAKANNRGIKKSKGAYILLLNPDTLLMGEPLSMLVDFMKKNDDIGVCGCKVLNKDGSIEPACRRGIPTPKAALYRFIGLNKIFAKNPRFAKYNLSHLNPHKISEVDAISGSFFMLKREVIEKTGLLDETFFLYGEEIDWCYRIKNSGWKIVYNPNAEIIHYKGGSSRQNKLRSFYEFYHSMFIFHEKHFSDKSSAAVNMFVKIGIILRAISLSFINMFKVVIKMICDLSMITLSFTLAFSIWYFSGLSDSYSIVHLFRNIHFQSYINIWFIIAAFMLVSFSVFGMYQKTNFNQTKEELVNLSFKCISLGMFLIILVNFLSRTFSQWSYPIPRSVFILWWGFSIITVATFRILFLSVRRKQKYIGRILLLGTRSEVQRLHEYFSELGSLKYHLVGAISEDNHRDVEIHYLGKPEDIEKIIYEYHINEVIITEKYKQLSDLVPVISHSIGKDVCIRLIPGFFDLYASDPKITKYAGIPTAILTSRKSHHWFLPAQRAIDFVLSLVLLILTIVPSTMNAIICTTKGKSRELHKVSMMSVNGNVLRIFVPSRCISHYPDESRPYFNLKPNCLLLPGVLLHILTGALSFIGPRLYRAVDEDVNPDMRVALDRILTIRPGIFNFTSPDLLGEDDARKPLQDDLIYLNNISAFMNIRIFLDNIRSKNQYKSINYSERKK
jgi:GT2 family glycosyltransferase/lipopolysaccharide/colanic/teichoic acid biosynthesis glycosyltransferase